MPQTKTQLTAQEYVMRGLPPGLAAFAAGINLNSPAPSGSSAASTPPTPPPPDPRQRQEALRTDLAAMRAESIRSELAAMRAQDADLLKRQETSRKLNRCVPHLAVQRGKLDVEYQRKVEELKQCEALLKQ